MKDAYVYSFYEIVKSTQEQHSYNVPADVEAYLVMLLSNFVEKVDIPASGTFAVGYLELDSKPATHAKELGDDCLFVVSVFPDMYEKKGLATTYIKDIGVTSYHVAGQKMDNKMFVDLSEQFDVCSKIISKSIANPLADMWSKFG